MIEKETKSSIENINAFIEENFGKAISKPIIRSIDDTQFPTLLWKNGGEIPLKFVRFLFIGGVGYDNFMPQIQSERNTLFSLIEPESGQIFASAILKLILDRGGFVKKNAILFVPVARLGGLDVIQTLQQLIIKKKRATLVPLLGINGTLNAAKALNEIPKNFKSKQGVVVLSCKKNFKLVAQLLGMNSLELEDEIIPDFGFTNLYYPFQTLKGQNFRAFISDDFKIRFLEESDKIRKSVPAQTPDKLKDKFKTITKEIRSLVKHQKQTLEQAMITERKWSKTAWDKHFLNKPLMFAFVQTLVWAAYDKSGNIVETFMVAQDKALENAEYDEVELTENITLGIIHPLKLSSDDVEAWSTYIIDNEIKTPFDQLHRKIYAIEKTMFSSKSINLYGEKTCSNIVGRGERRGWSRGGIGDGGGVLTYFKSFEKAGIDVHVVTEGLSIGFNYDCIFGELFFVKHGDKNASYYHSGYYRSEKDKALIALLKIPKVILSEVLADMEYFIS
jgi:hypothetical protein